MAKETFSLKLSEDWFKKGDVLTPPFKVRVKNLILRIIKWLGFYTEHGVLVLSDPQPEGDGYKYDVKIVASKYYAFYIRIWTRNYKKDLTGEEVLEIINRNIYQ